MNRLLLILFLCFYLYAVSGAKVAVHYCHGHFSTITFNANPDEDACCNKKRPMKKHACCNDKVVEIKIKDEQRCSATRTAGTCSLSLVLLPWSYSGLNFSNLTTVFYAFKSPPGGYGMVALFLKNCIFRI